MSASPDAPDVDPFGAFLSRVPPHAGPGPLRGARLCVKDNIPVAGQPFTAGHPAFRDRRAAATASAVARLLDAGAAFVGMTRTDAGGFGMTTPEVENPRFPHHMVGGSSGGAAAAVAAGLADLGLGTDTGGSIRVPAACTGLIGLKPSRDVIPMHGVFPLAPAFDHMGLVAQDIDLLETALGVFQPAPAMAWAASKGLRITVDARMPDYADGAVRAAFDAVIDRLRDVGHSIEPHDLPDRQAFAEAFGAVVVAEAAPFYAGIDPDTLGPAAARALRHAGGIDAQTARTQLATWAAQIAACLDTCDVLATPTLHMQLPLRGVHKLSAAGKTWPLLVALLGGTCFANVLGVPALALPLPVRPAPFSLHLAGRAGGDFALLAAARRILTTFDTRAL